MANIDLEGMAGSMFAGLGNILVSAGDLMGWILLLALIGGIIFFVILLKQYNITFIARKLVSGRTIITKTKARILKDKAGREILRFFPLKKVFGYTSYIVPPSLAQDIDNKGKAWVEAYYIDGEGFTYVDFPCELEEKINPLTIDDRDFLINEFIKSDSRKSFNLWANLPQLFALGAMLTVILILLLFSGDMITALGSAQKDVQATKEMQIAWIDRLDDVCSQQQTIRLGGDTIYEEEEDQGG